LTFTSQAGRGAGARAPRSRRQERESRLRVDLRPHEHPPASDTSAEVEDFLVARLRELSLAEKLAMVRRLNRGLVRLTLAGVRARYPSADARELALRAAALRLPRDVMVRAFGWDPDVEGL